MRQRHSQSTSLPDGSALLQAGFQVLCEVPTVAALPGCVVHVGPQWGFSAPFVGSDFHCTQRVCTVHHTVLGTSCVLHSPACILAWWLSCGSWRECIFCSSYLQCCMWGRVDGLRYLRAELNVSSDCSIGLCGKCHSFQIRVLNVLLLS